MIHLFKVRRGSGLGGEIEHLQGRGCQAVAMFAAEDGACSRRIGVSR
jgi:hypothetical protein